MVLEPKPRPTKAQRPARRNGEAGVAIVASVAAFAIALGAPLASAAPSHIALAADAITASILMVAGEGGTPPRPRPHEIEWRDSRGIGSTAAGSLEGGVMLPSEGRTWVSWDPVERDKPNRWWRRWGSDRLVRATLGVVRDFAVEHPTAPRVLIGDMSRPHGGDFGTRYGPIGHASHQNGLDVDVYYPRLDGREWTPRLPEQVDVRLAQDLVDRFVAAGAETVFVGPSLPLTGPSGVVVPLTNHDNHLHFRLPPDG